MKRKITLITIICVTFLFFFCAYKVEALETIIEEYPTSSDISYGEPLFQSKLDGGRANVDGVFYWKNEKKILEVGTYTEMVVFQPFNSDYEEKEILVDIVVNRRRVYIKFEDDIYKQYDGTTSITLPNYIVGGVIDSGVFVRGNLEGQLESSLVGESVVNLSGVELVGAKSFNYYLDLNGFRATIYRTSVEKFGNIKDKVEFGLNTYVANDAVIYVEKVENHAIEKKGYNVYDVYDIYLKSDEERIDISDKVNVKVKIDENSLNYRNFEVYNYYNGSYQKLDFKYEDGYILYTADGLGNLVFMQKIESYWWIYVCLGVFILVCCMLWIIKSLSSREKINKYKSIKRRKDYENY